MSEEYNSSLISKLNKATNSEEIKNILDDMIEVGSPVFLDTIFDSFEKNAQESFSHYYFDPICKIQSSKTGEFLDRVLDVLLEKKPYTIPWLLEEMMNAGYFTEKAISLAENFVAGYLNQEYKKYFGLDEFEFESTLDFLSKVNRLDKFRDNLLEIFLSQLSNRGEKKNALNYFLRIKPYSENFTQLKEIYSEKIRGQEDELILVKEIAGWTGTAVTTLKELIKKGGSERSREFLEEKRLELEQKEEKRNRDLKEKEEISRTKEREEYGNFELITKIIEARKQINLKTKNRPEFDFQLFQEEEEFIDLMKVPENEDAFKGQCMRLRVFITKLNADGVERHGLGEEEVNNLLSSVPSKDRRKSINSLFLFLTSKKLSGIEFDVFGLRPLNRLLGLVGAHDNEQDNLTKELSKNNLLQKYQNNDWLFLSKTILEIYLTFLEKLNKSLTEE